MTTFTNSLGITNEGVAFKKPDGSMDALPASAATGAPIISGGAGADPIYSTKVTLLEANSQMLLEDSIAAGGPQISNHNTNTTLGATARNTIATAANGLSSDAYTFIQAGNLGSHAWEYGVRGSDKTYQIQSNPANATPEMDGTTTFAMTEAGILSLPLNPSFDARLSVTDAGVTGMASTYTFGQGGNLVITQQGSHLSAAGIFTAPEDGYYQFNGTLVLDNMAAGMTSGAVWFLVRTNEFHYGLSLNPLAIADSAADISISTSKAIFLSASDTVSLQGAILGGAGETVDARGGAATAQGWCSFSGAKLS